MCIAFFFSSRGRHTRSKRDWSSDVCSSDLAVGDDCSVMCALGAAVVGVQVLDELGAGGCSPPLRMSMKATLGMRTPGGEEPRRACAGRGCGGHGGGVVVSLTGWWLPR